MLVPYGYALCLCLTPVPCARAWPLPQAPTISREGEVLRALSNIIDPDFGMTIVDCGFVKDLAIDESAGVVSFRLELTTPACPIKDDFEKQVHYYPFLYFLFILILFCAYTFQGRLQKAGTPLSYFTLLMEKMTKEGVCPGDASWCVCVLVAVWADGVHANAM